MAKFEPSGRLAHPSVSGEVALTVFCVPLALPVLCGSSGNRSSRLHRPCDWVR